MAPRSSNRVNEDDPYQVLGVSKDATPTEIRAAYRKLALRHHPDRKETPEEKLQANETFAAISHAYEILGDDARRREYDHQSSRESSFYSPFHQGGFHDPFDVFAQVFEQEFGGNRGSAHSSFGSHRSPFSSQDPFMNDPFFSGSMFGGDMFSNLHRQMEMMRQAQQDMHHPGDGAPNGSYYYSSSSSSSMIGGGNTSESVTTTTRMINGKRQTVTERTVQKADGTVERHVETTGDDDFPEAHRIEPSTRGQPRLPSSNTVDDETPPSPWKKVKRRLTGHGKDK
jgi:DnaJ family protein B protein 6